MKTEKKLTLSSETSPYALLEDLSAQESQSVRATRLNAFTLTVLSAVDILWTPNMSRHMLLTKVGGRVVLELFSLPCAFDAITSPAVGIPVELTQEIEESYAVLFNAWSVTPFHARFGAFMGLRKVCWCWSCSAYRYRQRCITACKTRALTSPRSKRNAASNSHQNEFDSTLETLMTSRSISEWTPDDFPNLWPRIARLEQHLQTSRPWSLSVLFRDRRDTMQFWTFLYVSSFCQLMQADKLQVCYARCLFDYCTGHAGGRTGSRVLHLTTMFPTLALLKIDVCKIRHCCAIGYYTLFEARRALETRHRMLLFLLSTSVPDADPPVY